MAVLKSNHSLSALSKQLWMSCLYYTTTPIIWFANLLSDLLFPIPHRTQLPRWNEVRSHRIDTYFFFNTPEIFHFSSFWMFPRTVTCRLVFMFVCNRRVRTQSQLSGVRPSAQRQGQVNAGYEPEGQTSKTDKFVTCWFLTNCHSFIIFCCSILSHNQLVTQWRSIYSLHRCGS